MPLQQINLGTPPAALDGDDPRTAFSRINANFKLMDDWGITGGMIRNITNLNDANQPGWYAALAGGAGNLPPGITYPVIFVGVHIAGFIIQEATDVISGKTAVRAFNANGAGSWGGWRVDIAAADLGTAAYLTASSSRFDSTLGRALKVGDFGWGNYVESVVVESNTINSVTVTGRYYVTTTNGIGQLPVGTNGYLDVTGHSTNFCIQFFTTVDSQCTYRRYKFNGNWGNWVGLDSIGVNQNWTRMNSSRALNTTYTNSSARPITVKVHAGPTSAGNVGLGVVINGGLTLNGSYCSAPGIYIETQAVIPPGQTYQVQTLNGTVGAINTWDELR